MHVNSLYNFLNSAIEKDSRPILDHPRPNYQTSEAGQSRRLTQVHLDWRVWV